MAEPEVEAASRAEFERSGVKELRDAPSDDGLTDELKRQTAFRWLGDEAEAQRLQQEQTHHYRRSYRSGIGAIALRPRKFIAVPPPLDGEESVIKRP
jgi:hypothetical protein